MDAQVVRQLVRQFRERTGQASHEEHAFAPWYLNYKYQLADSRALSQSSDGNYDFGIDGFHLELEGKPSLVLVQAKYSEGLPLISKGFKDLERVLPELGRALQGLETEEPIQNKVLVNLRAAVNRLAPEVRDALEIDLQVIHLAGEDPAILANRWREPMTRLQEAAANVLDPHRCRIRAVGPNELGPPELIVTPPEETPLRVSGAHEFVAGESGKMFLAVGRLADLVDLYRVRRDDLFSRNVRYYLTSKKNTEKGPAAKMRATLKQMCVDGTVDPERFGMFHNGITLFSRRVRSDAGEIRLTDPYVLNGCQTIKNAFLFRHDTHLKNRINSDLWQRVSVPIRVIETSDGDLIRTITVNNNRQNAMTAAALRANDAVQIRLEERFKDRRILYERQEGAFENIWATQPELLEDEYENTRGAWVEIHDLARAIAAAAGEVNLALHPNDLFESDTAYERCFDEKRRRRYIVFLTLLQNLHDVVGLVLKKDLSLEPKAGGPNPSRFSYHVICLIARDLAKEKMHDWVAEWGAQLHYRDGAFREAVRKLLNSNRSGIRAELARRFMTLESGGANEMKEAFDKCATALRLKDNIDPFEVFAEIDGEVPVTQEGREE